MRLRDLGIRPTRPIGIRPQQNLSPFHFLRCPLEPLDDILTHTAFLIREPDDILLFMGHLLMPKCPLNSARSQTPKFSVDRALGCSDEQICSRLRTDVAVMYACGIREVQVDGSQEHFVLPEGLAQFRSRLDEPLMAELLAIQAATAMEDGLVSPAHLVVDTFPSEQGSQRVNDAATLYKAQKKSSRSSRP